MKRKYPHVDTLTEKLAANIETFIQGELKLPEEEMKFVLECESCPNEKLDILSETALECDPAEVRTENSVL